MRRPIFARILILLLALFASAPVLAQSQLPPAIPQLRANPPGGRFALGFPAVPPSTLRAPLITDDSSKGYTTTSYWFDPTTGFTYEPLNVAVGQSAWHALQPANKNPLDGYATAPRVTYGTYRYVGTYYGPALQLRRTDTLAVQDIAFLADNWLDEGAANTFCAGTNCEVSIAYDQMGNCNATGANGTAPFYDSSKRINGRPTISFNSINNNIAVFGPPESNSYFTIPNTCLTWDTQAHTVMFAGEQTSSSSQTNFNGLFSSLDSVVSYVNTFQSRGLRYAGVSTDLQVPITPSTWMMAAGSSNWRAWSVNSYASAGNVATGTYNGAYLGYTATAQGARMWLQGFFLWTSSLSGTATEPDIMHLVDEVLGYSRQRDNMVVHIGASDGTGSGEGPPGDVNSGNTVSNFALPMLTPGAMVWNDSSHGQNLAGALSKSTSTVGGIYANSNGAGARNFVVVFSIVGNDIRQLKTLDYIKSEIQQYSDYVKGLGTNVRFVLSTQIFACDYSLNPDMQALLEAYNAWVYADGTKSTLDGGAGADAIYDRFANQWINAGAYSVSLMCDGSRSYDGVHIKMPGQMSMSQYWAAGVNATLK